MPEELYNMKPAKESLYKMEGISKRTIDEHFKLYEGYVKKANEITAKLMAMDPDPAAANPTYSEIRELKVEFSRAVGGVKNHDGYFAHLGGKGGQPGGRLMKKIEQDFWFGYDFQTRKSMNYIGDEQNTYPIWNATPWVFLDVFEHAYFIDFGTKKGDYIDTFLKSLDWQVVEKWADQRLAWEEESEEK